MSVHIRKRSNQTRADTYEVRYRLGGRGFMQRNAGTFQTLREARARRDLVAGEIAAGRDPRLALVAFQEAPKVRVFREWAEDWRLSRIDVADGTMRNYDMHIALFDSAFGDLEPAAITPAQVRTWIARQLGERLQPSSISRYIGTARMILDFAGVERNAFRDRSVKLPKVVREEPSPPTLRQVQTILQAIPARYRLGLRVLEATGMRIGELCSLEWGDVDLAEGRFRLARARTKTNAARWVQVPAPLMDELAETSYDDRTGVVFGFEANALRSAMAYACKQAGIPAFSPHDLRHRRLSLWHAQGIPARELAERAGHSRASMSLDVYSHVLGDPEDEWEASRDR